MEQLVPGQVFDHFFHANAAPTEPYEDGLSHEQVIELGEMIDEIASQEFELAIRYPATNPSDILDQYVLDSTDKDSSITVEEFDKGCRMADLIHDWWKMRPMETNPGEQ